MIDIDITTDFKKVEKALGSLGGEVEKAASRGINDALRKSKTKYKRHVKAFMGLRRVGDAAKLVLLSMSRPSALTGTLSAKGGTAARPSVKHLTGTRELKKSRVKWKSGGRQWVAQDSFKGKGKLNGHFFKRKGKKVSKLLGPSAADAINDAHDKIRSDAQKTAVDRFYHHIDRALKKLRVR